MSNSFQTHELQHAMLSCPSLISRNLLKLMSTESMMPSNHLIVCHPLFLLSSIFPKLRVFSSESLQMTHSVITDVLFITGGQYMGASASDFLWDWLVWSFCCLRDSQESSPAPQFIMHIHNSSYILPIILLIMYDFSFFKFTFSHFQPIFLLYNLCNCKMLT